MKRFLINAGLSVLLLLLLLGASALAEDLPEEVTLYFRPEIMVEKGIEQPANYPSTYQFPTGSDAVYKLRNNGWMSEDIRGLRVSQTGLAEAIEPPSGHTIPSETVNVI